MDNENNNVASPCVNICVIDPTSEFCIGCLRTRREIAGWMSMDNEDRKVVIQQAESRRSHMLSRAVRSKNVRSRRRPK